MNSYLRQNRRWSSKDVVEATGRLEKAFATDRTSRALAAMHKAAAARGYHLLPVERDEVEVLAKFKEPEVQAEDPSPFGGFSFRIPWSPSVNSAYFNKTSGGRAKTSKSRLFLQAVGDALLEQKVPLRKLSHPMAIVLLQHTSTAAGDIDNGIKLALDSLKFYGVIHDDNRKIVKRVTVEDGARVKAGSEHVEVTIQCLTA